MKRWTPQYLMLGSGLEVYMGQLGNRSRMLGWAGHLVSGHPGWSYWLIDPQEGRFPWLDCPPSQALRDDLEESMRRILYLDSPHGGSSLECSLRDTAVFSVTCPVSASNTQSPRSSLRLDGPGKDTGERKILGRLCQKSGGLLEKVLTCHLCSELVASVTNQAQPKSLSWGGLGWNEGWRIFQSMG